MANESDVVDVRGLPCPQPVILTRKALDASQQEQITVVADSDVARDNIVKMAHSLGCGVDVNQQGAEIYINITKSDECSTALERQESQLLLVASDSLGRGSEELGKILVKSFFYALTEQGGLGKVIIFINSGVSLACSGSPVLDYLYELEQDGAEVFACGTCLDYYKLKEQLGIGQITNMYTILEYLQKVPKVIYL